MTGKEIIEKIKRLKIYDEIYINFMTEDGITGDYDIVDVRNEDGYGVFYLEKSPEVSEDDRFMIAGEED